MKHIKLFEEWTPELGYMTPNDDKKNFWVGDPKEDAYWIKRMAAIPIPDKDKKQLGDIINKLNEFLKKDNNPKELHFSLGGVPYADKADKKTQIAQLMGEPLPEKPRHSAVENKWWVRISINLPSEVSAGKYVAAGIGQITLTLDPGKEWQLYYGAKLARDWRDSEEARIVSAAIRAVFGK